MSACCHDSYVVQRRVGEQGGGSLVPCCRGWWASTCSPPAGPSGGWCAGRRPGDSGARGAALVQRAPALRRLRLVHISWEFVDTQEAFERVKARSLPAGDIRTFDNFIVPLPGGTPVDPAPSWSGARPSRSYTAARYRAAAPAASSAARW